MTSSSSLVEMLKSIYSHPGGLLFTKFGSNQTTLLDLAFLDSFGRLHDRSKETPKTMKQLTRLFPNKVTIQMPQDELLLSDWKQQLDRDIETLKSQSNIVSIRAVLSRVGLDCSNLDALCVKDQALTNESVEKVIGWALSHHFMQSSEVLVKDAKPVISNERQITLLSELGERKDQSQNKKKPCRACGASWNCRSEKRCGCSWWKRVLFKRRWCASESSAYKLWS